jgi:hypothetical protein
MTIGEPLVILNLLVLEIKNLLSHGNRNFIILIFKMQKVKETNMDMDYILRDLILMEIFFL